MTFHHPSRDGSHNDLLQRDALNVGLLRDPIAQRWLTWITSLLHTNQKFRRRTRLENLITALVTLGIGLILCHKALQGDLPWLVAMLLIVLAWGHILFALRCFRLPNRHACAHGDLTQNPTLDDWIGQTLSGILWAAPMSIYKATHVSDRARAHHHWRNLLMPGESTFEEIVSLGFQPGVPNQQNWRHLRTLLLSPSFYARQLHSGLHAAFCTGNVWERGYNIALWSMILTVVIHSNELELFIVTFAVPRLLFESAQVLRVCVEHTFPAPRRRTMASYRSMTSAIISAEPAPAFRADDSRHQRRIQWAQWTIRMLFLHLPARFYVLTGDVATHDVHHCKPGADFSNFELERTELLRQGYPLTSSWGLIAAIDKFFTSLSTQPTDLFSRR
jgi:fatty acid desaturase